MPRAESRFLTSAVTRSTATVLDGTVTTTERVILMSYHLQAALACERHKRLLAERRRFARPHLTSERTPWTRWEDALLRGGW